MNPLDLISFCEQVYGNAQLVAGPDGRDGASLFPVGDDELVLAFRGTQATSWRDRTSVLDWLNDFHAEHVDMDNLSVKVHAGFLSSLDNLYGMIRDKMGDMPHSRRLFITGHSKGGAVAILAGVRLRNFKPSVVTFAAPMCGNDYFRAIYPADLTRYENAVDLVPMLPPFGYVPAGVVYRDRFMPDSMRKLQVDRLLATFGFQQIVNNHDLETGYKPWVAKETMAAA